MPDVYSTYDQRSGRIRRLGSKHDKVHIYNFFIGGAIDESKFNKIMKQKEVIDQVVENDDNAEDAIKEAISILNGQLIEEITTKSKKKKS